MYVKDKNGLQKHIMRYPQLFATKAIEKKLEEGIKKGIIWFFVDFFQPENSWRGRNLSRQNKETGS